MAEQVNLWANSHGKSVVVFCADSAFRTTLLFCACFSLSAVRRGDVASGSENLAISISPVLEQSKPWCHRATAAHTEQQNMTSDKWQVLYPSFDKVQLLTNASSLSFSQILFQKPAQGALRSNSSMNQTRPTTISQSCWWLNRSCNLQVTENQSCSPRWRSVEVHQRDHDPGSRRELTSFRLGSSRKSHPNLWWMIALPTTKTKILEAFLVKSKLYLSSGSVRMSEV